MCMAWRNSSCGTGNLSIDWKKCCGKLTRDFPYVRGNEGNLWVNWWNGSAWNWANQGNPPGATTVSGPVGVLTVMDTPTSPQRPYAFVQQKIHSIGH